MRGPGGPTVPTLAAAVGCLAWLGLAGPLAAATPARPTATTTDEVHELEARMTALEQRYEAKIAALEARIAALEARRAPAPEAATTGTGAAPTPASPSPADELAALQAAARQAAGGTAAVTPPPPPTEPVFGKERNLSRLNPEISFTGIFLGIGSNRAREEFKAQEFELDLQSALDPFSRTRWTVSFDPQGEVNVEEGWVNYNSLPGGLQLLAGKFRQRFGALNRQHLHALPQVDYPLVLETFFGEEGLAQTGLSADWVLPHPWASANEVTLELTDGENEAFGGRNFQHLSLLGHLKNFWDVSDSTYLEWGLSGITGEAPGGGRSRVWGTDLTFHFQPPQRAKYREITWRSELLLSQRDDPTGLRRDAWGGYSYLEGLVAQNLYAGLRADWVEDPLRPSQHLWGLSPYLTWWQSEFVRLRAELRHQEGDLLDRPADELFLQLTWAAGPHKHETY